MYIGIDPSLKSSGLCLLDIDGEYVQSWQIKTNSGSLPEKLVVIRNHVEMIQITMESYTPEVNTVSVETPFVANNKLTAFILSAVWGAIVTQAMNWHPNSFFQVHPQALKRFVTGKPFAPKEAVMQAVVSIWGFENGCHDIVDAFVLAHMGRCISHPKDYTVAQRDVVRDYLRLTDAASGVENI